MEGLRFDRLMLIATFDCFYSIFSFVNLDLGFIPALMLDFLKMKKNLCKYGTVLFPKRPSCERI